MCAYNNPFAWERENQLWEVLKVTDVAVVILLVSYKTDDWPYLTSLAGTYLFEMFKLTMASEKLF